MKPSDDWVKIIREAENILLGKEVLPIDALISIIKRINPTPHISLSPDEKEAAYRLKSNLQNLLLATHGELFDLEPVRWDENIVLLRYRMSPFVDACHAKLHTLSEPALAQVRKGDIVPRKKLKRKARPKGPTVADVSTLHGIVEQARLHMDVFEYDSARELLSGIRIEDKKELPDFLRAITLLLDELGAFDVVMGLLFALPEALINDSLREITANVCWLNNRFTDARGIFEECVIKELKKESIVRYADILYREGETRVSLELLNYAESMNGQVEGMNALRQTIYKKLKEEAAPFLESGKREFDENNFEAAENAARNALSIFSEYDEARELLRIIRDISNEDIVGSLWKSYHDSEVPAERLGILKKLQAKDPSKKNEILRLIEKASMEEKRILEAKTVSAIADHLAAHAYGKAFDRLYLLLNEDGCTDLVKSLSEAYPLIQDILNNAQLLRLKLDEARECWLSYLHLREISLDDYEKVLPLLKKTGKGFRDAPEYVAIQNKYNQIIAEHSRLNVKKYFSDIESENISYDKAREIAVLLKKEAANLPAVESKSVMQRCDEFIHKLQHDFSVSISQKMKYRNYCELIEDENITLERAEQLSHMMEKEAVNLPSEECNIYTQRCQEILNRLREDRNKISLRNRLMHGDDKSAISLKEKIADMRFISTLEEEISLLFAVEAVPINVTFKTDLYPFRKTRPKEGISFINCIGNEAFLNLTSDDDNSLIILNLDAKTATRFRMTNFKQMIGKVFHVDNEKREYHLLYKDTDNRYHYIKALFNNTRPRILAHINLSDLLGLDFEDASIDHAFLISGDQEVLNVFFTPEEDYDSRMFASINLQDALVIKKKNLEFEEYGCVKMPTTPQRFLVAVDKKLELYDTGMRKIKPVKVDNVMWWNAILINEERREIYVIIKREHDNTDKTSLLIFDYDLKLVDSHDDIAPMYDFSGWPHAYDSMRDLLLIGDNLLFDYRNKRAIKHFSLEEFEESDFIFSRGTLVDLCMAIRSDEYQLDTLSEDNNLEFLNNILHVPDLYERIMSRKPDLTLDPEIIKSAEETALLRQNAFSEIDKYDKWKIERLNRQLLNTMYPAFTPMLNKLSEHCFFFRQDACDYHICDYNAELRQLNITDISAYIDRIIDWQK